MTLLTEQTVGTKCMIRIVLARAMHQSYVNVSEYDQHQEGEQSHLRDQPFLTRNVPFREDCPCHGPSYLLRWRRTRNSIHKSSAGAGCFTPPKVARRTSVPDPFDHCFLAEIFHNSTGCSRYHSPCRKLLLEDSRRSEPKFSLDYPCFPFPLPRLQSSLPIAYGTP